LKYEGNGPNKALITDINFTKETKEPRKNSQARWNWFFFVLDLNAIKED